MKFWSLKQCSSLKWYNHCILHVNLDQYKIVWYIDMPNVYQYRMSYIIEVSGTNGTVLCVHAFASAQRYNLYTTCWSVKAVTAWESLLFNKRSSSERQFSLLSIHLSSAVVRKRSDTWHHVSRCFHKNRLLALSSKSDSNFALNSISYCWYLMKCLGKKFRVGLQQWFVSCCEYVISWISLLLLYFFHQPWLTEIASDY